MRTRTYTQMAKLLASKLSAQELSELTLLMDGDVQNDLLYELNRENFVRNPQDYVPGAGLRNGRKR